MIELALSFSLGLRLGLWREAMFIHLKMNIKCREISKFRKISRFYIQVKVRISMIQL